MNFIKEIGRYYTFMRQVFQRPEKWSVFYTRFIDECVSIGIQSIIIVSIMSIFIGAVITLQTAYNIDSPWIPLYTIGFTARQSIILEFSPTIIPLILTGIVGSKISSEIGSMRITEQIDALDVMGVNSASHLVLPKILAGIFMFPFLITISMFLGIFGGYLFGIMTGEVTSHTFIYGVQYWFIPYSIQYALTKTMVFAFVITSVSAFFGYYVKGGSIEVGHSSTKAVITGSILILILNYLITQWLLF
jgi:phospholipid/cholesterol/gamma-HCH transport system permease protein